MQNRWISYIFRYKENKKRENAGFVKLIRTSKGSADDARIEIGLKLCKPIMCRCRVYLIYDERELVLLEELLVRPEERDTISIKKSLPWKEFLKYGCTPRDYDGVFFAVDDGDTLMSLWNDKEIRISDLIPIPDYIMPIQNNLNYDRSEGVVEELLTEEIVAEELHTEEGVAEELHIEEGVAKELHTEEGVAEELYIEEIVAEEPHINSEPLENKSSVETLMQQSIKLPQFVDSPFSECVKILPQDIGRLPMGNWKLGQNSFLTHAYYRYKYIMLGKLKLDAREVNILGVPGVFTNKEKYLANMFGFGLFVPVRRTDVKTGSFGYWVWEIVKE